MEPRTRSLLGLHGAMLLAGGTALFAKLIHLPALDITAWRSVLGALALLAVLAGTGLRIRLARRRDYTVVLGLGVLFAVHWVSYFHAMQVSSVAVGIIALFTFPVITVFLEPLLEGGRPGGRDLVAAVAVLAGVWLMVPEVSPDDDVARGVFWGLVSAFAYAARNVLQRRHFIRYPGRVAMFWQILVVAAVTLPFATGEAVTLDAGQWALIVLLGVVFTAVPHALLAHALVHFRAATVSLINCLQVFYATALAALVLAEIPGPATLLGGGIIVAAAAWESARGFRLQAAPAAGPD